MEKPEMLRACLDLHKATMALFDFIEEGGLEAPLDSVEGAYKLKDVVEASDHIRSYYMRRNTQRMLALGITPEKLMRMVEGG